MKVIFADPSREGKRQSVFTNVLIVTEGKNLWPKGTPCTLQGRELRGAILDGTNFQSCNLEDTDLRGASLVQARFERAQLLRAQLQGAALDTSYQNLVRSSLLQSCPLRHTSATKAAASRITNSDVSVSWIYLIDAAALSLNAKGAGNDEQEHGRRAWDGRKTGRLVGTTR